MEKIPPSDIMAAIRDPRTGHPALTYERVRQIRRMQAIEPEETQE